MKHKVSKFFLGRGCKLLLIAFLFAGYSAATSYSYNTDVGAFRINRAISLQNQITQLQQSVQQLIQATEAAVMKVDMIHNQNEIMEKLKAQGRTNGKYVVDRRTERELKMELNFNPEKRILSQKFLEVENKLDFLHNNLLSRNNKDFFVLSDIAPRVTEARLCLPNIFNFRR